MIKRKFALGIILCILSVNCYLEAQQYFFKNFTTKNSEIAGNSINALHQDKRGYLWVACQQAGVSKFDGKTFTNFTKDDGLISNDISWICDDTKGHTWFGSTEGICFYNGFQFINDSILSSKGISQLFCDNKGNMWFVFRQQGLAVYDGKKYNYFTAKTGLPTDTINCITQAASNDYYIGTSRGLYKIDQATYKIEKYGSEKRPIRSILIDTKQRIWLGLTGFGVGYYDKGKFTKLQPAGAEINDAPYQIIQDDRENIWMASDQGVIEYTTNGTKIYAEKEGLSNATTLSICSDYQGNIWIGSLNGGLNLFRGESFVNYTQTEGFLEKSISGIVQDKLGNYIVGTSKGLYIYNRESNSKMIPFIVCPEMMNANVISIYIDRSENLWIGTDNNIIVLKKTNRNYVKEKVITKIENRPIHVVTKIIEDQNNHIWVSRFGSGITDLTNNVSYTKPNGQMPSDDITDLFCDKKGNIWIASILGGITKFDGKSFVTIDLNKQLKISSVTAIAEMGEHMFFGTPESGIVIVDSNAPANRRWSVISVSNGLCSNTISALKFDKIDNSLWVGTTRGLDKITLDKSFTTITKIHHYSEEQGFINAEINPHGLYFDDQANLWISTIEALVKYNSKFEFSKSNAIKLELRQLKLFYQNTDWKQQGFQIDTLTGIPRDLKLGYKSNNLTFIFQALTPSAVYYTYKLEGLENSWSPITSTNQAIYPNISPGKYIFKVKAVDKDGAAIGNEFDYTFVITPPFYETWWFLLLVIILISATVVIFVKWRTKSLINEKTHLEKVVAERTAEVVKEKDEATFQKNNAEQQRQIVQHKQKEILDSIYYAKRIQDALLNKNKVVSTTIPPHFILFMPKDIVSGDFFWSFEKQGFWYVAVADCTGHGVPGAFLTMLGNSFLNEINAIPELHTPATILYLLRQRIIAELGQTAEFGNSKDGMDISLARFNLSTNQLQWSGANNPLFIINRQSELTEIKPDKTPIGFSERLELFTNHEVQLNPGDFIVLFSDGYSDQFGQNGKKLMKKVFKEQLLKIHTFTADEQKQYLQNFVSNWKGTEDQTDDITVIGINVCNE